MDPDPGSALEKMDPDPGYSSRLIEFLKKKSCVLF